MFGFYLVNKSPILTLRIIVFGFSCCSYMFHSDNQLVVNVNICSFSNESVVSQRKMLSTWLLHEKKKHYCERKTGHLGWAA